MNKEGRKIIIIVDDEPEICKLFHTVLETEYNVFSFNNFPDAIHYSNKNKVDLLITDYFVPGKITSFEAIKKMKLTHQKIKVIMMSGNSSFKDDENISIIDKTIDKPVSILVLLQMVKFLLEEQ